MIEQHVLQYLKDNLYIIQQDDGYIISNKLTRELGVPSHHTIPLATNTKVGEKVVLKPAVATKEVYKQFITDAGVPTKLPAGNGNFFWGNRYSEPAFKVFKKVFDDPKIDRQLLLESTKWYYKQPNMSKVMISTYFEKGIWESNYDDWMKAKESKMGTATNKILERFNIPKIEEENRNSLRL